MYCALNVKTAKRVQSHRLFDRANRRKGCSQTGEPKNTPKIYKNDTFYPIMPITQCLKGL
jgi:hypothetical protein